MWLAPEQHSRSYQMCCCKLATEKSGSPPLTWMSVFGGVLKPKLNEQGPRHYQPGGSFLSFANYRLLKSTSMSTQRISPRFGAAPVISRFWDCQKKSFLLWRVLKTRRFSRSL